MGYVPAYEIYEMSKNTSRKKLRVVDGEQRGLRAPYGASRAQADHFQKMRDVKNEIYALEQRYDALKRQAISRGWFK